MSSYTPVWTADNGDGTYRNPILYTDYSDPDVERVGDDYYMVASSFCNVPAIPVLHSKDLVNWKVISYVLERIPYPDYDRPAHGRGVWAPSIRWHDGKLWVCFPMPDEGIFMSTAEPPFTSWSEPWCLREGKGWIDPCPLWDEDGKAYLVSGFAKSRCGIKSVLNVAPMEPDGSRLINDGQHVFDGRYTQPTIEGPKFYKRNGWYYIFAPAGSVKTGWQTVLRARTPYGPYQERIVMMQSGTRVNGPHQGGWVTTPSGQDWFIHFQDVGNAGRIVHLQPMCWENDWPVIGLYSDEGVGTPVESWQKPDVGGEYPVCAPDDSDDFAAGSLGLQWQWNANPREEWYSFVPEEGIRLASVNDGAHLCDLPNLLLQKWPAPSFRTDVQMDLSGLRPGDMAGVISFGGHYSALAAVCGENGELSLVQTMGYLCGEEQTVALKREVPVKSTFSFITADNGEVTFILNGKAVGTPVTMTPGRWVGVKIGLFIRNPQCESGGSVTARSFILSR